MEVEAMDKIIWRKNEERKAGNITIQIRNGKVGAFKEDKLEMV